MNKLNNHQIEFLLTYFENQSFINWKETATDLIKKGSSICAGTENIWKGDIKMFIKSRIAPEPYIDCIEYYFNLEEFTHTVFFYEKMDKKLTEMNQKRKELLREANNVDQKINSIKKLITYE